MLNIYLSASMGIGCCACTDTTRLTLTFTGNRVLGYVQPPVTCMACMLLAGKLACRYARALQRACLCS